MAVSDHSIDTEQKDDGTIHLSCKCGKLNSVVTDPKFLDSVIKRHFLLDEVWPFETPPKSSKWPHNTKEDDREEFG